MAQNYDINEIEINSIIGNYDEKIDSYLYLLKIKDAKHPITKETFTYLKIGITSSYYMHRIQQLHTNLNPMGQISILFLIKITKPDFYESKFKRENSDYTSNNTHNNIYSNKRCISTECYPYDKNMMYRINYFINSIKDDLDNFYINFNDNLINHLNTNIYKRKIKNSLEDIKEEEEDQEEEYISKENPYQGKIQKYQDISITSKLEGKKCSIFFNDPESDLLGWFPAVIKDVNGRKKRTPNCTFEVKLPDGTKENINAIITPNNYGKDKFWVLT